MSAPYWLPWLLLALGIIVFVDGLANLLYKRQENYHLLFQLGRVLRTICGAILIVVAVFVPL